jgi:hypothetical protein
MTGESMVGVGDSGTGVTEERRAIDVGNPGADVDVVGSGDGASSPMESTVLKNSLTSSSKSSKSQRSGGSSDMALSELDAIL